MAKLVRVKSGRSDYWINPLTVRWVCADGARAVIEFTDGKSLTLTQDAGSVTTQIDAVLDTASVWINDRG